MKRGGKIKVSGAACICGGDEKEGNDYNHSEEEKKMDHPDVSSPPSKHQNHPVDSLYIFCPQLQLIVIFRKNNNSSTGNIFLALNKYPIEFFLFFNMSDSAS